MNQSKWCTTSDVNFEDFCSGDKLVFVRAEHDTLSVSDGFKFSVYGLIDEQGCFHMLGHEVIPTKHEEIA